MEKGLTKVSALEKLKIFGRNEIVTQKAISPLALFLAQFPSAINTLLALATIFSFVTKDNIDGIIILAILLLNGLFGFVQEYKAEKSLEKLKSLIIPLSRVLRDGKEVQIETARLVPGDVVILSEGERVPADGIITTGHHLEVDESILTGESLPVIKKTKDQAFTGTLITKGKGHLLVDKTGMNTRFGQIAKTLSALESDKTPLQKRLGSLGKTLSLIVVVIALLLIPIGIAQGRSFSSLILLAISIGIAAIPEGLPAIITIALAIGTNRMAKKHAIVRKLPSVETLGAVEILLIDKTGTLTQNKMRVKKFFTKDKESLSLLLKASILGNTASLVQKEGVGGFDVIGDRTDGALLLWAKSLLKDIEAVKQEGKIIDEYVFDPATKTITTVFEKNHKRYVFVRGAPEEVLGNCKVELEEKKRIISLFESYAKEGLRVIGFGAKIETHDGRTDRNHLENNLDFLGIVGINDPPRPEAKQAVLLAKGAGVEPIMVTGDNEITALAIAKEVGLIEKDEDVITGDQLSKMSDEELEKIMAKTRIFARVKPEDKLRLVTLFKKKGYVVGVTGDGVNDALALKRADVGVAMGETGTDVAKEASDIVLTDDNFSTLVAAIEEGRIIYQNIVKSITYLLSGNLSELSLVFLATLLGLPAPLLPTQILWINLVTDGLPALALASDSKDPYLIKQKPHDPKMPILTKDRLLFIAVIGFGLMGILLFVFSSLLQTSNEIFARTVTFNLLVFLHLMIAFLVRGGSLFRLNKFLIVSVVLTLILQGIITTVPVFQKIFHLGF